MNRVLPYAACALALAMGCFEGEVPCRDREGFLEEYDAVRGSMPRDLFAWGGALYFNARDEQSQEAWRLHRYVPGAVPVPIEAPPSLPFFGGLMAPLTPFGDSLYAFQHTNLLRIGADGTLTQAAPLFFRAFPPGDGKGPYPAVYSGALYFQGLAQSGETELLRYDGTGVEVAADIFDDTIFGSYPSHLTVLGDTLYFLAGDIVNGRALWAFDGTNATLEHDFAPGSKWYGTDADRIVGARGTSLLLLVNGYGLNSELVSYAPGSAPITLDTDVSSAVLVGSTLIYTKHSDGTFYREDGAGPVALGAVRFWGEQVLWGAELDGTIFALRGGQGGGDDELVQVGPSSLLPVLSGTAITGLSEVVAFDGALYLSATDSPGFGAVQEGIAGHEIWRFDPATGALTLVADLWPGWQHVCLVD